jgi:hypothetical protein
MLFLMETAIDHVLHEGTYSCVQVAQDVPECQTLLLPITPQNNQLLRSRICGNAARRNRSHPGCGYVMICQI